MPGAGFAMRACLIRTAVLAGGVAMAMVVPGAIAPSRAQAVVATGVGTPFELAFWQSIDSSNDPSLYESYLVRFPNGTFSEIARAKIITLRGRMVAQPAPATPPGTVPVAPPPPTFGPAPAVTYPVAVPATPAPPLAPAPVPAPVVTPAVQQPMPAPAVQAAPAPQPAVMTPVSMPVPAPAPMQPAQIQATPIQAIPVQAPAIQAAPAVVTPAPAPAVASTAVASASTLGQLLAALANSQAGGAPALLSASAPAPTGAGHAATQPGTANSPGPANSSGAANLVVAPSAPVSGSRTLAAGFAVPPQPVLAAVPSVALPPSFCSAEARNAFHDAVYAPSVNVAKQNNDAAAAYLRQLQAMYDEYQLSHDPDTMNAIVAAARGYQPVAQTTFSTQAALVRQFTALMAVPVVPCSQPGQPPATTLAK